MLLDAHRLPADLRDEDTGQLPKDETKLAYTVTHGRTAIAFHSCKAKQLALDFASTATAAAAAGGRDGGGAAAGAAADGELPWCFEVPAKEVRLSPKDNAFAQSGGGGGDDDGALAATASPSPTPPGDRFAVVKAKLEVRSRVCFPAPA